MSNFGGSRLLGADYFSQMERDRGRDTQDRLTAAAENYEEQQLDTDRRLRVIQEREDDMKAKNTWSALSDNLQSLIMGRQYPRQTSVMNNTGYDVRDPLLLQMETPLPLPFDKKYATEQNLQAIINSLGKERYDKDELTRDMMQHHLPAVQEALTHAYTIYENVPANFYTNRFYIMQARQRQNSLYGF